MPPALPEPPGLLSPALVCCAPGLRQTSPAVTCLLLAVPPHCSASSPLAFGDMRQHQTLLSPLPFPPAVRWSVHMLSHRLAPPQCPRRLHILLQFLCCLVSRMLLQMSIPPASAERCVTCLHGTLCGGRAGPPPGCYRDAPHHPPSPSGCTPAPVSYAAEYIPAVGPCSPIASGRLLQAHIVCESHAVPITKYSAAVHDTMFQSYATPLKMCMRQPTGVLCRGRKYYAEQQARFGGHCRTPEGSTGALFKMLASAPGLIEDGFGTSCSVT